MFDNPRKADYEEAIASKKELLATIYQQRQQYEEITNLHRHLVAELEAYMISVRFYAYTQYLKLSP